MNARKLFTPLLIFLLVVTTLAAEGACTVPDAAPTPTAGRPGPTAVPTVPPSTSIDLVGAELMSGEGRASLADMIEGIQASIKTGPDR